MTPTRSPASGPSPLIRFIFIETVFSKVLVGACVAAGLVALQAMVREKNPDLAIPQAVVSVEWAGASPEQIEKEIVAGLEDEVRGLPQLHRFWSSAQHSFALLSVQFSAESDIPSSMQRLRSRVDRAAARFPRAAKKPRIEQIAVNDFPVQTYVLFGTNDDRLLARSGQRLKRQLEDVAGVRKVQLYGHREERLHVRLKPHALKSLSLSPSHVRERLQEANLELAWGDLEEPAARYALVYAGGFTGPDSMAALPIADLGDGRVVRLGEVAEVFVGLERDLGQTRTSRLGGDFTDALTLSILKRPGADSLAVIADVKDRIEAVTSLADWPHALTLQLIGDEGEGIEHALDEVQTSLLQGMIGVFVVLLTLLSWREATVAALGMPVSILAAIGGLYSFGFTLNTLVFTGIVIALGLLVDMFILVMEGVHERLFLHSETFSEAVIGTAKTFLLPALAGQLTTIMAMVPLLVIGGIDGKFIRVIPLTAIACLCASFGLAFVAALPLSRYVLAGSRRHQPTRMDRLTMVLADRLHAWLRAGPVRSKRSAVAVVMAAVALFTLSMGLALISPSELYPREDGRNLGVTIEQRPEATQQDARRVAGRVGAYLSTLPYLQSVTTHAAEKSPFALKTLDDYLAPLTGFHLVGVSARFVPRDDRDHPAYAYLSQIRQGLDRTLADEPGVRVQLHPDLGGATADDPIQIQIVGNDLVALRAAAGSVARALRATAGVTDVRDTMGHFHTELRFRPISSRLAFYGISEPELAEQMRVTMSEDPIGRFKRDGIEQDLDIQLSTGWPSRKGELGGPRSFAEIASIVLSAGDGVNVPLMGLVDLDIAQTPISISRVDGRRAVTVKAQLVPGQTSGDVVAAVEPSLRRLQTSWPEGFSWRIRGEAESAETVSGNANRALLLAALLVFAVLALLFGSFRQPLIILATMPLALTGTFLGFALTGIPLSFPAMIGIVAVIGIVVNDAIVMVDTMNGHLRSGKSVPEAAARGTADRLRPIFTTTVTTIVGLVPLALSSPMWFPLCMAIIYGETVATAFAIAVIPALFVLTTSHSGPRGARSGPMPRGEAG